MDLTEVLCRMWIECDPNRQGNEKGSGFHADDPLIRWGSEYHSQPLWKWFTPRAEASIAFLREHGYEVRKIA